MTTPNKCEHPGVSWQHLDRADGEGLEEVLACSVCGQRFIPSDVLEECRKAMRQALQDHRDHSYSFKADGLMVAALVRIAELVGDRPFTPPEETEPAPPPSPETPKPENP